MALTGSSETNLSSPERGYGGLFEAEDRFRLMVEAIADYSIYMLDLSGTVATWNLGAERLKGYAAKEIIGRHFSVFYPKEDIRRGWPAHELAVATAKGRYTGEGWRIRRDGSRFWANEVITILRKPDGSLAGFANVTQDLTERRLAEQGLRESNERTSAVAGELARVNELLTSVMDSTSNGIIMISPTWRILYGNRIAKATLTDFKMDVDFWECFPALVSTHAEERLRTAMQERVETHYEIFYGPYSGWYSVDIFPTVDGVSLFFSNNTAEKKLEQQLEHEQLLREKRIEALSHMAGGLAHEISNPLAIIHARASDLRVVAAAAVSTLPAAEVLKVCDSIVKTSDRAIKILRGLKGFAREASKDPMEPASIYEIAEQSIELQQTRFDSNNIEIRLELEAGMPPLLCREVQIGQILTNLLNNAFDAIVQSEGVERWVSVTAKYGEGEICVDVTDSGPGIEDHFKAHLMEPFFTTKELGLGMGVGLSLSRAMAQDHGGTLTLCDEMEHTCFRLILPIKPDVAKRETAATLPEVIPFS